jgi:exosortase A-associated hydrolase 2
MNRAAGAAPPAEPFFMAAGHGELFVLYHPAAAGFPRRDPVLFLPPFGEEMNKSRRMVSLQARRLAARGIPVLVPDLFGTGDSAGDFGEATWEIWVRDLEVCSAWLIERAGGPLVLWALRSGALLAPGLMNGAAGVPVSRLVLWQPVLDGRSFVQQLFRLFLASTLRRQGPRTTGAELRARLDVSGRIEIAGYCLSRELVEGLERTSLDDLDRLPRDEVIWLEVSATPGRGLSGNALELAQRWREKGPAVHTRSVPGDPFWTAQEITTAPELVEATAEALSAQ